MGNGEHGEFTFLDMISLLSFLIAIKNLEENLTQGDLQDAASQAEKKQSAQIEDIHRHLAIQDGKLDAIIAVLHENGGIFNER